MIKPKVQSWLDSQKATQTAFYANNDIQRFVTPELHVAQERMMRLGIEARALDITDEDELYQVAITILHNDYIKHKAP